MKRIIFFVMCFLIVVTSNPIIGQCASKTHKCTCSCCDTKKKLTKDEKKIQKAAKIYAKGHAKGYRYESAYEILEDFEIRVTKTRVKQMNKWVKHYESHSKHIYKKGKK